MFKTTENGKSGIGKANSFGEGSRTLGNCFRTSFACFQVASQTSVAQLDTHMRTPGLFWVRPNSMCFPSRRKVFPPNMGGSMLVLGSFINLPFWEVLVAGGCARRQFYAALRRTRQSSAMAWKRLIDVSTRDIELEGSTAGPRVLYCWAIGPSSEAISLMASCYGHFLRKSRFICIFIESIGLGEGRSPPFPRSSMLTLDAFFATRFRLESSARACLAWTSFPLLRWLDGCLCQ